MRNTRFTDIISRGFRYIAVSITRHRTQRWEEKAKTLVWLSSESVTHKRASYGASYWVLDEKWAREEIDRECTVYIEHWTIERCHKAHSATPGGTGGCYDNLRCHQRRQSRSHDNSRFVWRKIWKQSFTKMSSCRYSGICMYIYKHIYIYDIHTYIYTYIIQAGII